jgi:hypothetical protein
MTWDSWAQLFSTAHIPPENAEDDVPKLDSDGKPEGYWLEMRTFRCHRCDVGAKSDGKGKPICWFCKKGDQVR